MIIREIKVEDKELPEFKAIKKAQTNWQIREEEYRNIELCENYMNFLDK